MSKKPEEDKVDMRFYIYPPIDQEDGSIEIEDDLAETCLEVEELESKKLLSDYNQGKWDALCEIMATPIGILQKKLEELMYKIIDEETDGMGNDVDDTTPVDMTKQKQTQAPVVPANTAPKQVNHQPANTPVLDPEDDISDEELIAEFSQKKSYSNSHQGAYCGMYDGYGYD